jgi:hypothetical protein
MIPALVSLLVAAVFALLALGAGRFWRSLPLTTRFRFLFLLRTLRESGTALVLLLVGALFLLPLLLLLGPDRSLLAPWPLVLALLFLLVACSAFCNAIVRLFKVAAAELPGGTEHERGRRLGSVEDAERTVRGTSASSGLMGRLMSGLLGGLFRSRTAGQVPPSAPAARAGSVFWGMLQLPEDAASLHFLVCGSTGSGKTLLIRLFLRSVLPGLAPGSGRRALVFDAKRELLAGLPALAPRVPVRTLDPFDARGVAWDVAADITTGADAAQFAQLLIPETGRETQRYFTDAARDLLRAAVEGLQARCPGRWTLRDVILLVQSRERLQAFLTPLPEVLARITPHLQARECASVLSTLATRTGPLSVVAALWEAAAERFSLTQWLAGESVLVFAHDPVHREALEPVNRAFFARAANLLLSRTTADRTYVVLDEAREAGRLDGLRSLLNTGRSKGVSVLLGFQDFDGLKALYGAEEAHELTGQCGHKTFLRTDSTATAEWMQAHAGRVMVREAQPSLDPSRLAGLPQSVSYHRVERHLVLAAEFMDLPATSAAHGLRAFHLLPEARHPYWTDTPLDTVLRALPGPAVPAHVPRPAEQQRLRPWDDEDARRLGVPVGEVGKKENSQNEDEDDDGPEEPLPPEPPRKPVKPAPPAAGGSPGDRLRSIRRKPRPTEDGGTG